MKSLCIHSLVIFLLQTHVRSQDPCGERNVTGAVGGAITLHVTDTENGSITWTFVDKGDGVAITRPGGSLEIQGDQYDGRLGSSSDGSLTITNLQHEDQGTYRAQILKQKCFYHLSVFRNLTAENITISSNVTNNTICEVILTCSVNSTQRSNVIITWRSLNSGDISPLTENVVLVPPSHINFTYICTATNPVSNASKAVIPAEYCEKGDPPKNYTSNRIYISTAVAGVGTFMVVAGGVVFWIVRRKRSISESQERIPSTKEPNPYEFNDEEGAACPAVRGDKEQKAGKDRNKQNNVKGKQEPSVCVVTTVYDEVRPLQGKSGKQSKAPKGAVSKSPESCYSTVQLPMTSPKGANRDLPQTPVESCYAEVTLPKVTEPAKDPRTL